MVSDLSLSNLTRLPGARVSRLAMLLRVRLVTPLGQWVIIQSTGTECLTDLGMWCRSPGTRRLVSLWPRLRLTREERAERFTEDRER